MGDPDDLPTPTQITTRVLTWDDVCDEIELLRIERLRRRKESDEASDRRASEGSWRH